MHLVTKEVEQVIRQKLPDKFAIALDGWSAFSTFYVGIFGIYSEANGYQKSLLSFSPLLNEERLSAEEHRNLVIYILSLYQKNLEHNVVAIVGDNCEVNKAFSSLIEKPLIGCANSFFPHQMLSRVYSAQPVFALRIIVTE